MKVVAMLGGLGSQMFKYAFYLQIKETDECYIDTTPFRLQKMWNGYELGRIFGIEEPDITEVYTDVELDSIKDEAITYKKAGEMAIEKINTNKPIISIFRGYLYPQEKHRILLFFSLIYNKIKRCRWGERCIKDTFPRFYKTNLFSIYYDEFNHTSDKYLGAGRDINRLKEVFKFPVFISEKNNKTAELMQKTESVAMHIRRSDHMYDNAQLFENGYFVKAVTYIKQNSSNPAFFLFSDEPDWCKNNLELLGLEEKDSVEIVDWNNDLQSFRDMQLMTYCQHNILAISSFSWWGYYLSKREKKIVCAPEGYWLEVPVHF